MEMKCEIDWDMKWMYTKLGVRKMSCVLRSGHGGLWFLLLLDFHLRQGWVISFSPPRQVQAGEGELGRSKKKVRNPS